MRYYDGTFIFSADIFPKYDESLGYSGFSISVEEVKCQIQIEAENAERACEELVEFADNVKKEIDKKFPGSSIWNEEYCLEPPSWVVKRISKTLYMDMNGNLIRYYDREGKLI